MLSESRLLSAQIAPDVAVNKLTNYDGVRYQSVVHYSASCYATVVTPSVDGDTAWTSTLNGRHAPDDVFTSVSLIAGAASQSIDFSGFTFGVPSGSVIDGIKIDIRNKGTSTGTIAIYMNESRLDVNGSLTNDRVFEWSSSASTDTLGSASDLWGLQSSVDATYAHINSLKYKVKVHPSTTSPAAAYIDAVKATVYWHIIDATKQITEVLDTSGSLRIKDSAGDVNALFNQDGSTTISLLGIYREIDMGLDGIVSRDAGVNKTPAAGRAQIYQKGTKIVIGYNDSGTMRYTSIDMSGTGTWTNVGTGAP